MKVNSMSRIVLAVVLNISLIATGCSAQWVSVALADLPVLTQTSRRWWQRCNPESS